jgi:hypothetical protein
MNRSYKLFEYTSLDDVSEWIKVAHGDDVELQINSSSGFAPTVEGVALSSLQQVAQKASLIVKCGVDTTRPPKIFDSLFGLSIALVARAITGPEGQEQKAALAADLWRKVLKEGGQVGAGNHRGIVFRDPDYWMPQCLRSPEGHFPKRDLFRSTLLNAAQRMGFLNSFSSSEEDVITFLYEATQNSHDHARVDANGRAVSGIRGILLDRVTVSSTRELEGRRDLSEFQRSYIRRAGSRIPGSAVFFAFTVADLGAGIQNTLPATPDELGWDRLNRAFSAGETRKPRGAALESGQGLAKLRGSAKRLRALLFVKSADLAGYIDYSLDGENLCITELPTRFGSVGTSLTLMWPATKSGGDQKPLFE